jgi:hypothetical protein
MTDQQIAARKGRMYALIGVGIAAFVGAYQFATTPPPEGTPSLTVPVIFVVAGVICLVVAGLMARSSSKETAPK